MEVDIDIYFVITQGFYVETHTEIGRADVIASIILLQKSDGFYVVVMMAMVRNTVGFNNAVSDGCETEVIIAEIFVNLQKVILVVFNPHVVVMPKLIITVCMLEVVTCSNIQAVVIIFGLTMTIKMMATISMSDEGLW